MPSYPLKRLCVYCASSTGTNPNAVAATIALGNLMADRGIELVYGGGAVGHMGLLADTVMEAGGTVTGVIPTGLFPREVGHSDITELIEVADMHTRKAEMMRLADAFLALPGGFGTLEELAEALTWSQLGIHAKPIGLLNVDGFYDHLLAFFDRCVSDELLKESNRARLLDGSEPAPLLDAMATFSSPAEPKWIQPSQLDTSQPDATQTEERT